jgi:tetratricopeptide (TPR) repeat protein
LELEPVYITIHKVDNVRHAYLGLEGTILSFDQRQAAIDSELLIPVELVTISQGLRFKGRRLVAALLCLLLPMLLCGVIWGLFSGWSPTVEIEGTLAAGILAGLSAGMLLAGFVAFFILLIMFFFRVKTVRLKIEPGGAVIEFYQQRQQAAEIDDFLEQLRLRQGIVSKSPAALVHRSAGFTKEQSIIPRFAALLWLASLPALMTQRAPLLFLSVGVLVWFAYRQIQYGRQPREYRQAIRHYLRGDYDDAIDALEGLRSRIPGYLPTYFCLAEACVRGGRFEQALEVVSRLASDYPDVAHHMETDIWLFKRIHQRRSGTD